jgi:DNA mismatch repair protein MutH
VDLEELHRRAHALTNRTLDDVARSMMTTAPTVGVHTKGKVGALIEAALGATGGSRKEHDFPELGVELKTVPVDASRKPRESTYVCRIALADAERAEWETSWVRRKLSHVLFVPIHNDVILAPVFFRPSAEEDRALRFDFDALMGAIGAGHIEDITAHEGEILQIRPKARDGSVRTTTYDRDGELVSTIPRGFYLRARFVGGVLASRR